jgi:hypothetical protein
MCDAQKIKSPRNDELEESEEDAYHQPNNQTQLICVNISINQSTLKRKDCRKERKR